MNTLRRDLVAEFNYMGRTWSRGLETKFNYMGRTWSKRIRDKVYLHGKDMVGAASLHELQIQRIVICLKAYAPMGDEKVCYKKNIYTSQQIFKQFASEIKHITINSSL